MQNNRISIIPQLASLFSLVLATCPAIDYWCNWYISMIPLVIVILYIGMYQGLFKTFVLIILFVLIHYWVVYRDVEASVFIVNGILVWVPVFIAVFGHYYQGIIFKKRYIQIAAILLGITSVTTILGLDTFPNACRELASGTAIYDTMIYSRINIGGYEFIYSLVIFIPVSVWLIRNSNKFLRLLNVLLLILYVYCIFKSSYTIALFLSGISVCLIVININPKFKPIIIGGGILLLLFAGTGLLADLLYWISSVNTNEYTSDRILQVAQMLDFGSVKEVSTNTTNERLDYYDMLKTAILNKPLFGHNLLSFTHNDVISGHSTILDIISGAGLFGLGVVYFIYKSIINNVTRIKQYAVKYNFNIIWTLFIITSILNPTNRMLIYFIIFPIATFILELDNAPKTT